MASNYQHLWSSNFKTQAMLSAAKNEWAIDLAEFTPEQIGRAIEHMKEHYPDRPPTLPQFKKLCRIKHHASHTIFKPLPTPLADKSVAAKYIAKMRAKLA